MQMYTEEGLTAGEAHRAILGVAQQMVRASTGSDRVRAIGAAGFAPRGSVLDGQHVFPRRRTVTA